jgi:hypothetical protein
MEKPIKEGKGTLIGNAGEYYVMAELLKRSIIAALAPRNTPNYDILAAKDDTTVRIRVKTKSGDVNGWKWMAKTDGTLFRDLHEKGDFTVLVDLTKETADLKFYIFPTSVLNQLIYADFDRWKSTPGAKGQVRNQNNPLRVFQFSEHLEWVSQTLNQWDRMWA